MKTHRGGSPARIAKASEAQSPQADKEIEQLYRFFEGKIEKIVATVRQAVDEVIDGPRTGRVKMSELEKTEKTYLGTKVEILLRFELELDKGRKLDFVKDDIEVDCKYSQKLGGWAIPQEAVDQICLLITANDEKGTISAGLMRCTQEVLNKGQNQDGKRTIIASKLASARWIIQDEPFPINLLTQLPKDTLERISTKPSGQQRVNELLRSIQNVIISRNVIATVAKAKDDPMKRVRANGGARGFLNKEGILILGHQEAHPELAKALGVPVPRKGEIVSVQVTPTDSSGVRIGNEYWRKAKIGDPIVEVPETY